MFVVCLHCLFWFYTSIKAREYISNCFIIEFQTSAYVTKAHVLLTHYAVWIKKFCQTNSIILWIIEMGVVVFFDTHFCSTRTFVRHVHLFDTYFCSTHSFVRHVHFKSRRQYYIKTIDNDHPIDIRIRHQNK